PTVPLPVMVLAMYTLGELGSPREAIAGGAWGLLTTWVAVAASHPFDPGDFSFTAIVVVTPLVLGRVLGASKREARAADERADLERERAAEAIAAERRQIARELHDVVAHSISVMGIQAGAARRARGPREDDGRTSLLAVEATGREALGEMRRLLGILRDEGGPLSLAPQPGLGALDDLVASARAAGQDVDLRFEGDAVALPPGVDL